MKHNPKHHGFNHHILAPLARQLTKEAKWSLYLTIGYLIGWVVTAYCLSDNQGIFGFPIWFEASCLYLPVAFVIVGFLVLKGVYQDVDLDTSSHNQQSSD